MNRNEKLILASSSKSRSTLMRNAGLEFETCPAEIDERGLESSLESRKLTPNEIALTLAEAKAISVSLSKSGNLVIGADQILSLNEVRFNKPADISAARNQLKQFSGKTHSLHSAIVCAKNGKTIWQHFSNACLTMRNLSDSFIEHYLEETGDKVLDSVGCYQLEGRGIQLFERIEGDYFTILGMPMLPLLVFLRKQGIIES